MKLITIQHEEVFKLLQNSQVYQADYSRVSPNLVAPYQMMQKYYGWDTCPVFGGPIGKHAYFRGCKPDGGVALQLNIPDDIVKIQYFYDWTDIAYFSAFPDEFAETFDLEMYPTLESYARDVFECKNLGSYNLFQATIPFIRPEWLESSFKDCNKFLENYDHKQPLAELQMYLADETHLF